MAKNVNHVSHIKSTSSAITSGNSVFIADGKAGPKLPVASTLIQGEIAVNLAKDVETLSIVNTSGEIVTFSSDKIIKKVIVDNEQVTSAALNDLEERKQNKLTAGDGITIDSDNVISADDTTYTAGEGISISSSNVISNTAITIVDNELLSSSTNPVANSAVTAAISALTVEVRNNELVDAAALNDLNSRKLDASAITGYATEEWVTNQGYLTEHQSLSGYATTAVTNQLRNDVNTLSGNSITGASYNSTTKKIEFTTSTGKTIEVDATAFIKDGMVDTVAVSDVTSGSSTVKCLVVTFNTDAGKQDINIALSEMFDTSLYYTKTEIDNKLGSGFTGSNSGVTVTQAINDSEKVVAAALNDLNNRKLDASAYTEPDLSAYATEEWVSDRLGSGFTGDNSGISVTQTIEENGLVVAAALNDLNNRKLDASAYTPTDLSNYYTKSETDGLLSAKAETTWVEEKLGSGFTGDNSGNTVTKVIEENELVVAAALNDLNSRKLDASALTEIQEAISDKQDALSAGTNITIKDNVISAAEYVAGSGITISGANNEVSVKIVELRSGATYADDEIPSAKSVKQTIVDNELVVASALNDLEERKLDASAFTETAAALETLSGSVRENELVVAASLNDLNSRLTELEDTPDVYVSGGSYDTTNGVLTLNQANGPDVNVTIQAGGSSGGEANVITGVSVNGSAITLTNKVANITSVPASIVLTSSTLNFVSSTEKNTWNNKQNALSNASVLTGITSQKVSNWDTVTAKTDNTAFTAHTADTTVHVTSTEKSTWNGKQDALSNASVLSGITSQQVTNWDNAYTSAHSHSNKSVLDGINTTKVGNWDSAATNAHNHDNKTILDNLTQAVIDNSHTHTNRTVLDGITTAKTAQWDNAISAVSFNGTDATVTNHKAAITATIPTSLSQLTSAHTHAISEVTNLQSTLNAKVSGITVNSGSKVTPTNGVANLTINASTVGALATGTTLDGIADGTTRKLSDYATTGTVNTHTGNTAIHLPAVTAADNGKILMVVNGQWALVNPTTIYTGTGTPQSGTGNDGDIYLQTS